MTTTKRPRRFMEEEDVLIAKLVNGVKNPNWDEIASHFNNRTKRQIRERWNTYLAPYVNMEAWTDEEDEILIKKINVFGFSWTKLVKFFNNRTQMSIKNRWNCHLRSIVRLDDMGRFFFPDPKLKNGQQIRTSKQRERQKRINLMFSNELNASSDGLQSMNDAQSAQRTQENILDNLTVKHLTQELLFRNEIKFLEWDSWLGGEDTFI